MADDNQGKRETSFGVLYQPKSVGVQIMVLFGAFVYIPGAIWLVSRLLGGLSESAQAFIFIPLFLILLLGYGLWLTRLQAIAFAMIGKALLRAIFQLVIRRKKPDNPEDLFPTVEKFEQMAVRAQQAASSFFTMSIPVAVVAGLTSILFESASGVWSRVCVVSGTCLLWGFILTYLGKRGYLPLPEEGE